MDRLTPEQAFRARELSESGIWSGRIAVLLGVDERLVLRALSGETFAERPTVPEPPPPVTPRPQPPPDPNAWPPPADDSTVWGEVVLPAGYGVAPERVRVRWVPLWGKRVRIRADADVWCPHCLRFRSVKDLGHPWNRCPVGLPYRGGILAVDFDEPEPREAVGMYRPRFVDFSREPM